MGAVKRRPYDASRRRRQARITRDAIIAAARRRFLADGFAATTIASIAADAGASTDTIYKTFGGKTGLLRAAVEDALAGPDAVPTEQRSDEMQAAETDPRRLLRKLGRFGAEVAPRGAPLVLVLAAAAATDSGAAELLAELDAARLARMTQVARRFVRKADLRPGMSVEEAADAMWAFSSPELYGLLVLRRGWSAERYGEFVGESLVSALLPSDPTDRPPSRPGSATNTPPVPVDASG